MKLKVVLITILVITFLPLFFVLGSYTYLLTEGKKETLYEEDYYKKELYNTFNDNAFVKIFYYYDNPDNIKNKKNILSSDNINKLKKEINFSLNRLHELNNVINLEFNYDIITEDDYYLPIEENENEYYFQYYDTDGKVLYEIFCSK